MALALRDTQRHTYAEYCTWTDNVRYELIDGVAYIKDPLGMAPAPVRTHQRLVAELFRQIADALDGLPCEVNIAPFDVRLAQADEADEAITSIVQPDIVVVCDPAKLDEKGCRGAPDWVIEVLSPATAAYDQIIKLALYERHGVHEYWLVHALDHTVTVYRLSAAGVYGRPSIHEFSGSLSAAIGPGVSIDWLRVLQGLP